MKRLLFLSLLLIAAVSAWAVPPSPPVSLVGVESKVATATVATLPAAGTAGTLRQVTDGADATDCTVGGGATVVLCQDTGVAWTVVAAAGSGDLKADGTVPLSADWDVGAFKVRAETFESDVVTAGTGSTTTGTFVLKNATNNNTFTIQPGVTGASISWMLPTAAPGGADYLLNVDADGTMGYTDPSSFGGGGDLSEVDIDTLSELNTILTDATLLDDGAIATSTAIGLTTGDSLTNISGNATDDTLNEYLAAIDTAVGGLGGGHDALTLAADADTVLGLSTQELGLDTQTANYVFAGPVSGAAADPTFRALVADDIPDISATYLTAETDPTALLTAGTDNVKDTHIDWGSGAGQVNLADIPGGTAGADTFDFSAATVTLPTLTGLLTANAGISVKNGDTSSGFIYLYEDSDNGTDYMYLRAAEDVASEKCLRMGTSVADDEALAICMGGNDNTVTLSSSTGVTNIHAPGIALTGGVYTISTASSCTIGTDCDSTKTNVAYGGVVYVTGAATVTLPDIGYGMSITVITVGDVAVSVDTNANDLMYLDGVALNDGDKATNRSTTGDLIHCNYYSAAGWYCASGSTTGDQWTDGGP